MMFTGRNRALFGGRKGPPRANMVAWFRKGVGITSAANAVSVWADQSGLGSRDYAQATGAAQPALQGDGTILFDGSSDFLKTPAFVLIQPYTRYLRVKQVTWVINRNIVDGNTVDSGDIYQATATPTIGLYAGTAVAANTDLAVNTWGSVAAVFNGASSSLRVGAAAATTGNPGASSAGGLTMGASAAGTSFGNIQVAEEIVYSVAHDAATQALVIAYLNTL